MYKQVICTTAVPVPQTQLLMPVFFYYPLLPDTTENGVGWQLPYHVASSSEEGGCASGQSQDGEHPHNDDDGQEDA